MNGFKKPFWITVSLLVALIGFIYQLTVSSQAQINDDVKARLEAQANEINGLNLLIANINATLGRIDERTQWLDRLKR